MIDLTEKLTRQLAEWSLPEHTEFYVRKKDGSTDTQTWINRKHSSPIEWWNIFNITEVLAPVPSYDEYLSLTYAKEEDEKIIAEYEEENAQLKALLKEVGGKLKYINTPRNNHNIFENDLMKKINQVLGEDK